MLDVLRQPCTHHPPITYTHNAPPSRAYRVRRYGLGPVSGPHMPPRNRTRTRGRVTIRYNGTAGVEQVVIQTGLIINTPTARDANKGGLRIVVCLAP